MLNIDFFYSSSSSEFSNVLTCCSRISFFIRVIWLCFDRCCIDFVEVCGEEFWNMAEQGSSSSVLQLAPFQSMVDEGFWHRLSSLKLNELGIDDSPISITGTNTFYVKVYALVCH